MSTRRFEMVGNSGKFWEITQDGSSLTVTFGKIGAKGQSKTKALESEDSAGQEVAKLIGEKTGKGYAEVEKDYVS